MLLKRDQSQPAGLRLALRALRFRNYRLFFFGQGISFIGTWMQSIATSWLVFRMTDSPFMLGLTAFAGQIPVFLISPLAGVLVDRFDRRRILVAVQVLSMAQAFTLAAVTLAGVVQVWQVIALGFCLGMINAFEMPARQSFVILMVEDRADLGNAIALNSGLFNGSRLIGPAIAGLLVAYAGEGVCFLANGVSYLAALVALLMMKITRGGEDRPRARLLAELREGLAHSFGFRPIRDLILTVSLMSLVAMSFPVLLPVFATRIFGGGSHTYGFMVAASGLGALMGTIFLAMRKNVLGLGRVIVAAMLLCGAGLVALSFSRVYPVTLALLVVMGFGMISTMASCNTMVQSIVDEDKRGRVMSLYIMAFMGTAPLGSLITGSVSSVVGPSLTALFGGILCLAGGSVFALRLPALRQIVRPIYRKMGIIPEVAAGIQSADEVEKIPE
jgi:MFS family permease